MARPKRTPAFYVDEDALQIYAADVLRAFANPGVMWWHTPNGGYRHPSVAKLLKSMGTKPGIPDLTVITPLPKEMGSIWYALGYVEIKLGKKGRQSPEQIEFEEGCKALGIPYILARSCEEIDNALRQLGAIDKPVTQPAEKAGCVVQNGGGSKGRSRSTSKRKAA